MAILPNAIIDAKTGKIISQVPYPEIINLVFGGAGVKGLAYGGFAKILEQYNLIESVKNVAGSSAGAIAALVVSLGYNAQEAKEILQNVDIKSFVEKDISGLITPEILLKSKQAWSLLSGKQTYLSTGRKFYEWLEKIVEPKLNNKQATFRDLERKIEEETKKFGRSRYKHLYITGTNVAKASPECEVFSYETTPDMPIARAVRISGSVPILFKPIGKYVDGGVTDNLPTSIFLERRFLPTGYDFTDLGANPGTLAIKIDSQSDADHTLWGISEKIDILSLSHIISSIYKAYSRDDKLRNLRAHQIISLPDNGVPMLEFSIDDIKREKLITAAEKVSQQWAENLASAAYDVKIYDNLEKWLESLYLDEINQVIATYEMMRKIAHVRESYCEQKKEHDPNQPTEKELIEQIEWLEKYLLYRIKRDRDPSVTFKDYPKYHINIKSKEDKNSWPTKVINDMKDRLEKINHQIEITKRELSYLNFDTQFNYDDVKTRTGYFEYLKFLEYKRHDLIIKLDIKNDTYQNVAFRYPLSKENSKQFKEFCDIIRSPLNKTHNYFVSAILKQVDLYHPKMTYCSQMNSDNVIFTLHLRYEEDRKYYLLAANLFLSYKEIKIPEWLSQLYQLHFGRNENLPETVDELKTLLKIDKKLDLYAAVFRIEELVHNFEKEAKPKMTPQFKKFIPEKALLNDDIELKDAVCLKNIFVPIATSRQGFFQPNKPDCTPAEENVPFWFIGKRV